MTDDDGRMDAWGREIRASYDQVAGAYEHRFADELDGKPRDRALLQQFAASCGAGDVGDVVIDVGCGPGHIGAFVRDAAARVGVLSMVGVVGVDLSHEMAKSASARLDGGVVADMRALPFRSASIGGVVAFYSLIHVMRAEVVGALREFARVVRAGAPVLVSAHEGEGVIRVDDFIGQSVPMVATLFALDELQRFGREAGLDVVSAERRAPYPTEGSTTRLYVSFAAPAEGPG